MKSKNSNRLGKWTLISMIGEGGNGSVWKACHNKEKSQVVAIKILKKNNYVNYLRFKDEIQVLKNNENITGLLKIIDADLPEFDKSRKPWFAMPLGIALKENFKNPSVEQVVQLIIEVAKTLSELHNRGISHRDIKPANIIFVNEKVTLSDFGLVDYPNKKDVTEKYRDLGAKWTIAPEMRRDPANADGKPADVYSLAKTFWILLTKEAKGFEGQYTPTSSISLGKFKSPFYTTPLDKLLQESTDHLPSERPTINQFLSSLLEWQVINEDFEKKSKLQWFDMLQHLYNSELPPITGIWQKKEDIIEILNYIGKHDQLNHTLFPDGGGLDLIASKESWEEGCIEINYECITYILLPKALILENFQGNSMWNYFWLETQKIELLTKKESVGREELTEIEPGKYVERECYDYDEFNGDPLPQNSRVVIRNSEGTFLICLKVGPYNQESSTYDGRHNKVTREQFRKYISTCITANQKSIPLALNKNRKNSPVFLKSSKIRPSSRLLTLGEREILNRTIRFVNEIDAKRSTSNTSNGIIDSNEFMKLFDLQKQMQKVEKPFVDYLGTLTLDEVKLIEAVMYGGRDASPEGRAIDLNELLGLSKHNTKDEIIRNITGKGISVSHYISKGLKVYV